MYNGGIAEATFQIDNKINLVNQLSFVIFHLSIK